MEAKKRKRKNRTERDNERRKVYEPVYEALGRWQEDAITFVESLSVDFEGNFKEAMSFVKLVSDTYLMTRTLAHEVRHLSGSLWEAETKIKDREKLIKHTLRLMLSKRGKFSGQRIQKEFPSLGVYLAEIFHELVRERLAAETSAGWLKS